MALLLTGTAIGCTIATWQTVQPAPGFSSLHVSTLEGDSRGADHSVGTPSLAVTLDDFDNRAEIKEAKVDIYNSNEAAQGPRDTCRVNEADICYAMQITGKKRTSKIDRKDADNSAEMSVAYEHRVRPRDDENRTRRRVHADGDIVIYEELLYSSETLANREQQKDYRGYADLQDPQLTIAAYEGELEQHKSKSASKSLRNHDRRRGASDATWVSAYEAYITPK